MHAWSRSVGSGRTESLAAIHNYREGKRQAGAYMWHTAWHSATPVKAQAVVDVVLARGSLYRVYPSPIAICRASIALRQVVGFWNGAVLWLVQCVDG
jgi:hypothetical protein